MFMIYLTFFVTIALLIVLGLYSTATGAGPAGLKTVQDPLRPVVGSLKGFVGTLGIIAFIWGVFGLISCVLSISMLGGAAVPYLFGMYAFLALSIVPSVLYAAPGLLVSFILVTVGALAGYVSVAAFFGAPASGAGKFVDWFKRTFGPNESIIGLISLVLGLWILVEFILVRSGVAI